MQKKKKVNFTIQAIKQAVDSNDINIEEANEIILEQKKKENQKMLFNLRSSKEDFKRLFNKLKVFQAEKLS